MNLATTKSVASAFFSRAAEEASDAGSSSKTSASSSRADSDDSPDFLALLTLLFPGNLLAPTTPTVTDESTGRSADILRSDAAPANGLPNALDSVAQAPIGPMPEETPFAEMHGEACRVTSLATDVEAPSEAEADTPPSSFPSWSLGTSSAIPTASSVAPSHATDTDGRGNAVQSKALLDSQATSTQNVPKEAQETSPNHESAATAPMDAMKNVHALTNMDAGLVNEKSELASDLSDEERSPSALSAPVRQDAAANPLAARTETSAKPAISFVDQVHSVFQDNLDHLRQHGRVELHMDLHPPDLGRMRLHLSMEDNQVNVRMDVQDERAKQVLEQQLQPLRVHFAQLGVTLGQLDVRRDGTGNAPQQDQYPDAPARAPLPHPRSQAELGNEEPEAARLRSAYERELNSDSLVDVLA